MVALPPVCRLSQDVQQKEKGGLSREGSADWGFLQSPPLVARPTGHRRAQLLIFRWTHRAEREAWNTCQAPKGAYAGMWPLTYSRRDVTNICVWFVWGGGQMENKHQNARLCVYDHQLVSVTASPMNSKPSASAKQLIKLISYYKAPLLPCTLRKMDYY